MLDGHDLEIGHGYETGFYTKTLRHLLQLVGLSNRQAKATAVSSSSPRIENGILRRVST